MHKYLNPVHQYTAPKCYLFLYQKTKPSAMKFSVVLFIYTSIYSSMN